MLLNVLNLSSHGLYQMFEELTQRTSTALINRAKNLSKITLSESLSVSIPFACFKRITTSSDCSQLTSISSNGIGVYVLAMDGASSAKEAQCCLAEYKAAEGKGLKFPRFNKLGQVGASSVLYVGSSHKLKRRINEQLFNCTKETYALRLSRWAQSMNGSLSVKVAVFESATKSQLQDIEDQLASELLPIFGKRGSV